MHDSGCEHTTDPYRITYVQRHMQDSLCCMVLCGNTLHHLSILLVPRPVLSNEFIHTQQLLADSSTLAFRTLQWTVSSPGTVSIPLTQFVLNLFFLTMVICNSFLDVGLNFLECFDYTLITCCSCLL